MANNLKNLQTIPGVGPKISKEFADIGIKNVSDLKGKDPEKLYLKICAKQGVQVDRCVLYTCRSSVYFAEHKKHNPEKLKWWNWKDKK
ncbi:MAG: helix-hairpin-helix domain-containing protein [Patescibacteria group bacterium]|nr:helix-hairpin-helix domain-containing protein [Patescibacteria group bacterium]